jgi:hypothetical protein
MRVDWGLQDRTRMDQAKVYLEEAEAIYQLFLEHESSFLMCRKQRTHFSKLCMAFFI